MQSTINEEVQQTITNTINNIDNNNSDIINSVDNRQSQNVTSTSFQEKVSIIDNMPAQKIRVGDIEIAYKQIGQGVNPIVLITGGGVTMDGWSPYLIDKLTASNDNRVIIFDNRGAGETTIGTKEFSINQFAEDTIGLLDALDVEKADVLGFSMGAFIAQELASLHPDRVNNLILYASSCGGPDAVPPSPEVIQTFSNTSLTPEETAQEIIPLLFPPQWFRDNPNYLNYVPIPKESVTPEVLQKQSEAITNWSGNCNVLANITSPTMAIVGTEDVFTPPENSVNIVEKIPGAWLIQIRDAGHGLMDQYPQIFNKIIITFLNIHDIERSDSNSTATR